jgi:DNA-binding response OmpR family regulator
MMMALTTFEPEQVLTGHRILITEDQYLLANDLVRGLTAAGAEIIGPAPSVARSLELLRASRPTAAVLDINLDGDSVYAVAQELVRRHVPFVITTGYPLSLDHVAVKDAPMLQKPFELKALVRLLHELVPRH